MLSSAVMRTTPVGLNVDAIGVQPVQRVDLFSARFPDLKVQVRSSRKTSVAHSGNLLPSFDSLSSANRIAVHMSIHRDSAIGMFHPDPKPKATGRSGLNNHTISCRQDWSADRACNVDAVMSGTPAPTKARSESTHRGNREFRSSDFRFLGSSFLSHVLTFS